MNHTINKIELTAPAGGWDQLVAAVNAGADSVYLGYKKFGARAYAENFDINQIKKAVGFAHSHGVKVYLTLNTLVKDREIPEVINFLNEYIYICSDGIIIQDYGIYKILKDLFKTIPIHASTQLNIHNIYSLKLSGNLGFKRVILAREMTLDEIKDLCKKKLMEIEVFGHGSQCYSYSGSCYFSSFVGGRSGNRGKCAQPCRMKYKLLERDAGKYNYIIADGSYIFSKSDLCILDIIPKIIAAGISALKIEGRMKSPEYVGMVTKIYRKYIDLYYENPLNFNVDEYDSYKLTQIFSREMGTGYLKQKYPKEIISLKKSGSIGNFLGRVYKIDYEGNDDRKNLKIKSIYIRSRWKINSGDIIEIWTKKGNSRINIGNFKLIDEKDKRYTYEITINKKSSILEKDRVFKYFDKKIDDEAKSLFKYDINKDSAAVLSRVKTPDNKINEKEIENYLNKFLLKNNKAAGGEPERKLTLSVYIYEQECIEPAVDKGITHIIYSNFKEMVYGGNFKDSLIKSLKKYNEFKDIKISINTPSILYDDEFISLKKNILKLLDCGLNNFKISNPGVLELLNEIGCKDKSDINLYLGFNFNLFNSLSVVFFKDLLSDNVILKGIELSPELNLEEILKIISNAENLFKDEIEFSIFGHGYFPVMNSRYKIKFLTDKSNSNKFYIEDIKGYRFPAVSDYNENMIIFNSRNICTLYDLDNIKASGVNNIIIDSRFLEKKDFYKILRSYREAIDILYNKGTGKYKIFTSYLQDDNLFKNYSKGHLLRGVN
jgi:putative protease